MIFVMTAKGKGVHTYADSIRIDQFNTQQEAQQYIDKTSNPDSKYWTIAEKIELGKTYEAFKDSSKCTISQTGW